MTVDRVLVDTNVLLYACDDRDPEKQATAQRWLEVLAAREAGVVTPQVIGEMHAVAARGKIALEPTELRRIMLGLRPWSTGATDLELIGRAWSLHGRTRFQWWDCVILAGAIRAGCRYLLSEDYEDGRTIDGTTIVNPFRTDPMTLLGQH